MNLSPRKAADIAAITLVGISGLHVLWANGVIWPAKDSQQFSRAIVGQESDKLPPTLMTYGVAGLLVAAALTTHSANRPGSRLAIIPEPLARVGAKAVAGVLATRAAAVVATLAPNSGTPEFKRWNTAIYSPLCAALAWAVRPKPLT